MKMVIWSDHDILLPQELKFKEYLGGKGLKKLFSLEAKTGGLRYVLFVSKTLNLNAET